ncbi:putative baseplate assembly protein [Sorangium sp. So ce542]|uniref:putative baseplate assembly protein n=1 Tax=Sorangium sp. So ce542 TaxID=3133316 RepID=UPI003F5EDFAD
MKALPTPPQDTRDSGQIEAELRARAPGYVPELLLQEHGAGAALAAVFARYARAIRARLNQAPDKNKLAFLAALGIEPTSARAARAPVVFQLNDKASASAAPAGTAVAAPPAPGGSEPIVFETERAVGITAGRLAQVVSLWPGRDAFIDHSAAFAAGRAFRTFAADELDPVEHIIYLSHEKLLALSGSTRLSLEWQLAVPGSEELSIQWEYWDGKVWREFLELNPSCLPDGIALPDSTSGLTRSGKIELRAEGARSEKTTVNGEEAYWLRGRVQGALSPDPSLQLPEVDTLRLSSTVEQPLVAVLRWKAEQSEARVVRLLDESGQALEGATITARFQHEGEKELEKGYDKGEFRLPVDADFTTLVELRVTYFGVSSSLTFVPGEELNDPGRITLIVTSTMRGLAPDQALGDGSKLDTSKPFYPFGQQPAPGAAFYLSCDEAFTKVGGTLRLYVPLTAAPLNDIDSNDAASKRTALTPLIAWEYWNGRTWAVLVPAPVVSKADEVHRDFTVSEVIDFLVPADFEPTLVNDIEALWIRARLVRGGFGYKQEVTWEAGTGATNTITYVVHQPPVVATLKLAYSWHHGPLHLDRVLTYNDFRFEDHTDDARWPGATFAPFQRIADELPALYLGFDRKPPADAIGLFFPIVEQPGADLPPELSWEYWNGFGWQRLSVEDETQHLRFPGISTVIAQSDSAELARFGRPLHWLRLRSKVDGPPAETELTGIYPNAVWASQQRTYRDLAVGQGTGGLNQVFVIPQVPVLPGERIEVRELFGPRAAVEWRLIALDLFAGDAAVLRALEEQLAAEGTQTDVVRGPLRLKRDRLKRVNEVWVQWQPVASLLGRAADERCYSVDRARGLLHFGDGRAGRVVPAGAAIQARFLQSGGGKTGNVPARALSQLQTGVPGVEAVFNPCGAEGGADGESAEALRTRAPFSVRHRGRAIDITDYATLAREASAAVAFARAIPTRSPNGQNLAGWVKVIIIPHSLDARPFPSVLLRQQVERYLAARAPAELAADGRISVVGPDYFPIDITATIAPRDPSEAGQVERAARAALERFFHPLYGGPSGQGWDLGRHVFPSDVAAVLERVPGLDFTEDLALLAQGVPQGDEIVVADEQIVVAGTFRLKVQV